MSEEIKQEPTKLENIKDILESLQDSILHNHIIQDNKYLFNFDNQLYRVRMPSQREKAEADLAQNNLYLKLIHENLKLSEEQRHKTKNQLKKVLKDSGVIDIEELEIKRSSLHAELNTLYYELAERLSNDVTAIDSYKGKILKVKEDFKDISVEIATYLMPSIDDRKEKMYIEYVTFLCTEKLIKKGDVDAWEKVWNTIEDYQQETSGLADRSAEGTINLLMTINQ